MGDDWKPRKDDHLVEPMFAGLGVEQRADRRRARLIVLALLLALSIAAYWLLGPTS